MTILQLCTRDEVSRAYAQHLHSMQFSRALCLHFIWKLLPFAPAVQAETVIPFARVQVRRVEMDSGERSSVREGSSPVSSCLHSCLFLKPMSAVIYSCSRTCLAVRLCYYLCTYKLTGPKVQSIAIFQACLFNSFTLHPQSSN